MSFLAIRATIAARQEREAAVRQAAQSGFATRSASLDEQTERSVRERPVQSSVSLSSSSSRSQASVSSSSVPEYPPELAAVLAMPEYRSGEGRGGVVRAEISAHEPEQALVAVEIPEPELRNRLAQYEQQLRNPNLSAAMRQTLTERANEIRARLSGAPPPAPIPIAPAPAVPLAFQPPAELRQCIICCESYRLEYARRAAAATQEQPGDGDDNDGGGAGVVASARKKSKRTAHATAASGSVVVDRYRFIFQFEEQARGVMNDDFIFAEMVWMHQDFIERPLERLGFPVVRWTEAALREHYDTRNGHTFDKVREVQNDLTQLRTLQNLIYTKCTTPDPGNPAQVSICHKSIDSFEKIRKSKQQCIDALAAYQNEKACIVKTQTRDLANVLGRKRLHEAITISPQVAAGNMRAGGDALRTAGVETEENGQKSLLMFGGF